MEASAVMVGPVGPREGEWTAALVALAVVVAAAVTVWGLRAGAVVASAEMGALAAEVLAEASLVVTVERKFALSNPCSRCRNDRRSTRHQRHRRRSHHLPASRSGQKSHHIF